MTARNRYRPQFEQLEQRAVPAGLTGPLTGHHPLNTSIAASLAGVDFLSGNLGSGGGQISFTGSLGSGLLKNGKVTFAGGLVGISMTSTSETATFLGTLTITTKNGKVNTADLGTLTATLPLTPTETPTFTVNGQITGGTKDFKGVSGNFTVNGTVNIIAESISGTLTGTIIGGGKHHHHHP